MHNTQPILDFMNPLYLVFKLPSQYVLVITSMVYSLLFKNCNFVRYGTKCGVTLTQLGVVLSPLLYDKQMCLASNMIVFMRFGIVTLVF